MDNTIPHHNGDFLQRRFYALPRRNLQPVFNTLPPEMEAHARRDADSVPHGNAGMRRVWTRSFAGDNVRFGTCNVVRYT